MITCIDLNHLSSLLKTSEMCCSTHIENRTTSKPVLQLDTLLELGSSSKDGSALQLRQRIQLLPDV